MSKWIGPCCQNRWFRKPYSANRQQVTYILAIKTLEFSNHLKHGKAKIRHIWCILRKLIPHEIHMVSFPKPFFSNSAALPQDKDFAQNFASAFGPDCISRTLRIIGRTNANQRNSKKNVRKVPLAPPKFETTSLNENARNCTKLHEMHEIHPVFPRIEVAKMSSETIQTCPK